MKPLLILFALFFQLTAYAQLPELYGEIFEHQSVIVDAVNRGATWMKISEKEKEDEPSSSSIVVMSPQKIESITRYENTGSKINTTSNEYNAEGQLIYSTTVSPKEKELAKVAIAYDHLGNPISRVDTERGKIIEKQRTWYNAEGNIREHIQYKEGGNLILNQWYYDYTPSGELWHTYLLDAKKDTLTVWTYACNKSGRLNRAKNEVEICRWTDKDRFGNTLVFEKRITKKSVRTLKEMFTPEGLKIASVLYDAKEQILERYSFEYVNGLLVETVKHEPNDNDGFIWKETRDYHENGDLYNVINYDSRNEPTRFIRYEYQY